jgi:hypothetical protein
VHAVDLSFSHLRCACPSFEEPFPNALTLAAAKSCAISASADASAWSWQIVNSTFAFAFEQSKLGASKV